MRRDWEEAIMKDFTKKRRRLLSALAAALIVIVPGLFTGAIAEDLTKIIDISPVPRGSAFSPVVGQDGLFIRPRSGPLESMDAKFIVIGDVKFRMASTIRFLGSRSGATHDRANFMPGTFVEYLINDAREVYAIWPSSGS